MKRAYNSVLPDRSTCFPPIAMLSFIAVYFLTSCAPSKSSYYFKTLQKDTTIAGLVDRNLESKIVNGDQLAINVSSLSKEEDVLFNSGSSIIGSGSLSPFIVDNSGNITVHKLGSVKAAGVTRRELASILQKSLIPYLKDPIVTVQYVNHKVTVMGEVEKPQVINMAEEQISVIDALVICGDVKSTAKRDNILVIREDQNQKKVKILNFEDHSIFSSPWYYLQPNDIVYVVPDEKRRQQDERRTRFQTNFAIVTGTISLLIIILDRIFR